LIIHIFKLQVNNEKIFHSLSSSGQPTGGKNTAPLPLELIKQMGHDVRNALTSIQLLTQIGLRHKEAETSEHLKGFLTRIDTQSAKLANLVNELVDITRIQSGRLNIRKQPVDLKHFLEDTQNKMATADKGPLITWPEPQSVKIELDPGRIHQVMTSVIFHATKRLPGLSRINITTERQNDALRMSMEVLHAEPDAAVLTFPGLGDRNAGEDPIPDPALFIAAEIIRSHEGAISLSQNPETGTTVHITLPLKEEQR
jgi:signal transduction histidine kinase